MTSRSPGSPPPPDAGTKPSVHSEPFYTNEDVAVLHNIVLQAEEVYQSLPEKTRLPTNALFDAYYEILPKVGVNADHDSRYARILFKIGGLRGPGTIYEKFEEILSRMGIEIEFDQEHDQAEEEQLSQFEESQTDAESMDQQPFHDLRGRQRRYSESSAWQSGTGVPQEARGRPSSVSSLRRPSPRPFSSGNIFPQSQLSAQQKDEITRSKAKQDENDRPKQSIRTWLASSEEKPLRERSISRQTNLQIRRRSPSASHNQRGLARRQSTGSDDFQSPSEITAVTSAEEQQRSDSPRPSRGDPVKNTASGLMEVKASLLLHHRLGSLAKRQLRIWRDKALHNRKCNANSNRIALYHDRKILLQLALDTWHERLLEKQHSAETERFYAYLEQRASGARDLYLLHKAFSHWRVSAYDEVERTSIARRHIIRTRTFNAWREITAVNELKVRRHVIKKFFSVWRRHNSAVHVDSVKAVQIFEGNLVEKAYRKWIQRGREIKAVIWWAEGFKLRILFRWNVMLRNRLADHNNAEQQRRLQLLWKTWQIWRTKTNETIRKGRQAKNMYDSHARSNALRRWRGEARVIPARIAVQIDVSSRLLRETLAIWLHRSRQARQAVAIDHLRVLREAWTTWRHKVRFQILRARVDDRVIQEAIYKWILNERVVLSERNLNRRLLQTFLPIWAQKLRAAREHRWDQEDVAQSFAIRNTQSLILSRWRTRTDSQKQLENDASDHYKPKFLQGLLSEWSGRTQHLQKLDQWSRDAEFYFLASKCLKRWNVGTETAKREKRKVAYTQVRRMTKMNRARGALLTWRNKAQLVLELQVRAEELAHNKTVIIGMNKLDCWRARTEELGELEPLWRETVLRKKFMAWKDRSLAFQDLEMEAIINYQQQLQGRVIKKWSLLMIRLRSRLHSAQEIREKNLRRTFRKTFNYWHQRTLQKRPAVAREIPSPGMLGATGRAEAWSDFGENEVDEWARGLDDVNALLPVPGYLSTPSKRMERVTAAAVRFSTSTTPRAPLSTPFERHLRNQYSGGHFASVHRAQQRSNHIGGGFANISDRDANNDHEIT